MKNKEDLARARKECIVELGIPATLVAEYQKRVFNPEGVTPCYLRCVFKRLGLFGEGKGFFVEDYLTQVGRGDTIKAGVTGCIDNTGTDECLWAYRGFMCFFKGGFLPEGY